MRACRGSVEARRWATCADQTAWSNARSKRARGSKRCEARRRAASCRKAKLRRGPALGGSCYERTGIQPASEARCRARDDDNGHHGGRAVGGWIDSALGRAGSLVRGETTGTRGCGACGMGAARGMAGSATAREQQRAGRPECRGEGRVQAEEGRAGRSSGSSA